MKLYKCKFCNGKGHIYFSEKRADILVMSGTSTCPSCAGKGKLDWVENVTCRRTWLVGLDLSTFKREVWWDGSIVFRKDVGG